MKLPALFQIRVLKKAFAALFSRPYTTSFPRVPFEPILQFRGRPRYSEADCIGCGTCAEVCPADCIDVQDVSGPGQPLRRLVQHLDVCICCGQCERYCPTKTGIRMTNEFDFVGFQPADFEEKVEKELVLCEHCGGIIAARAHLQWLVARLGQLAYDNPTLMMTSLRELGVVAPGLKTGVNIFHRGRHLSVQCPRCRRQSALQV
ncbi:4Fe-4S dicluster domain-containing protein [candidate division FCPU426 bacterium]|nr:4Fe-4S dicluster domain-containing protein [candidate division FCPU426 bacterium]